MPLKLNVGLSRKIGQPNFGSTGASCGVEFEVESSLLQNDPDAFHRHVRGAYVACQQAVDAELARNQQVDEEPRTTSDPRDDTCSEGSARNGNGQGNGSGPGGHRASAKQVEYINQLARQIKGLGVRRLETLAQKMFGKPVAALTTLDASGLIDCLKALKAGEIDVDTALNGAAT